MPAEPCDTCKNYSLVCENHPDKAWPSECECGPGVPCPACRSRQLVTCQQHYFEKALAKEVFRSELWCVCWYGNTEDYGWRQHRGPAISREEATKRIIHGRKKYPHIIFWLEPYRQDAGASSIP